MQARPFNHTHVVCFQGANCFHLAPTDADGRQDQTLTSGSDGSLLHTLLPPTPSVTLAMSRVPSPPPPAEMSSGPVAESWCYTQVKWRRSVYTAVALFCSLPSELSRMPFPLSDQSGEVLIHVDHQQLQLLSWGDGRGHQELHLLFWGQWQAEVVGEHERWRTAFFLPPLFVLLWLWAKKTTSPALFV